MSIVDAFVSAVTDGPLLVAAPVAATAGLVSFLSPCVLPLVPGYLSYMTGLTGLGMAATADPEFSEGSPQGSEASGAVLTRTAPPARTDRRSRRRLLAAACLFVGGFSTVFVTAGALFGGISSELYVNKRLVDTVLGSLTILMGLAFIGLVPGMQRELRSRRLPAAGLAGAPMLGVVFGVGWTPCLGPTLGAVQTLAYTQASAGRGALLTAAYCAGLGVPFLLTAVAYDRALRAFAVLRRHSLIITRLGGIMIICVGLALVTGLWEQLMIEVRVLVAGFSTPL